MQLHDFMEKKNEFLQYLEVERNLARNTHRAYKADLNQYAEFWNDLTEKEKQVLSMQQIFERYLVSLFYKKTDKSSIVCKLFVLNHLNVF